MNELDLILLDKVVKFQDALVSFSTGSNFEGNYSELRSDLINIPQIKDKLPDFVRKYRDLSQYWQFIKRQFQHYADRRMFIWDSFYPLIEYLENNLKNTGADTAADALKNFTYESVHAVWQKALDRRNEDPDGAITAARTLLETTCKHILDEANVAYDDGADLPKLWAQCAAFLKLAPNLYQEELFKTILGNCQSIVNTIGAIRNKVGDAHGKGSKALKPKPKHAELVVNLAGTMASFLINTWIDQKDKA